MPNTFPVLPRSADGTILILVYSSFFLDRRLHVLFVVVVEEFEIELVRVVELPLLLGAQLSEMGHGAVRTAASGQIALVACLRVTVKLSLFEAVFKYCVWELPQQSSS